MADAFDNTSDFALTEDTPGLQHPLAMLPSSFFNVLLISKSAKATLTGKSSQACSSALSTGSKMVRMLILVRGRLVKSHRRKRIVDNVFITKCLLYEPTSGQRNCIERLSDEGTGPIIRERVACIESTKENSTVSMSE